MSLGTPRPLPGLPEDIETRQQDAARAVRLFTAGPDSTSPQHTMASAARAVRNALRGIR